MNLFQSACVVCGASARGVCGNCADAMKPPELPSLLAVDSVTVLCSYEGIGAELVRSVKYGNKREAIWPIVDALVPNVPKELDAIVSVPSDPARVRERGFDLPARMARLIGRRTDTPVAEPLQRVTSSSQTGQSREQRQTVEFRAAARVPDRILLVDDVVTTGATAVACAVALGLAGAQSTNFVAIAATPPRRAPEPAVKLSKMGSHQRDCDATVM